MSLNNFIPKVWAANLISAKDKVHVFGAVAKHGTANAAHSRIHGI